MQILEAKMYDSRYTCLHSEEGCDHERQRRRSVRRGTVLCREHAELKEENSRQRQLVKTITKIWREERTKRREEMINNRRIMRMILVLQRIEEEEEIEQKEEKWQGKGRDGRTENGEGEEGEEGDGREERGE